MTPRLHVWRGINGSNHITSNFISRRAVVTNSSESKTPNAEKSWSKMYGWWNKLLLAIVMWRQSTSMRRHTLERIIINYNYLLLFFFAFWQFLHLQIRSASSCHGLSSLDWGISRSRSVRLTGPALMVLSPGPCVARTSVTSRQWQPSIHSSRNSAQCSSCEGEDTEVILHDTV